MLNLQIINVCASQRWSVSQLSDKVLEVGQSDSVDLILFRCFGFEDPNVYSQDCFDEAENIIIFSPIDNILCPSWHLLSEGLS